MNAPDSELRDLLTLHLVPGIGPRLLAALIHYFGSAGAVLKAPAEQLQEIPHIGAKLARQIRDAFTRIDVDEEFERMRQHNVRLLPRSSAEYPPTLNTIANPPSLLYVRGDLHARDSNAVAIVGSRHCSSYGKRVAERLAFDLARAGFTIISGLARGIDGVAHRGALQGGGRTIAVVAGGLSKIYPPEHDELAERVQSQGAVLSESSMLMEPMAGMFPSRNRVISGLARAVVLVEAAERSGALITATHAAEQGREVFAVPGPVDSPTSSGTLKLLRHGARLVRNADDIIEDLDGIAPLVADAGRKTAANAPVEKAPPDDLDEKQQAIWDLLSERRSVDTLAQRSGLAIAELSRVLMVLEIKKVIRRLPGSIYERW